MILGEQTVQTTSHAPLAAYRLLEEAQSRHAVIMSTAIESSHAPAAVGPYSQAIEHNGLLYCSGSLGLHPTSGDMAEGIEAQTQQSLDNLEAVCSAAGTHLSKAIRCTVYLTDLGDFAVVNALYAKRFSAPFPARACVQVSALPKGGVVEIDAIVAV